MPVIKNISLPCNLNSDCSGSGLNVSLNVETYRETPSTSLDADVLAFSTETRDNFLNSTLSLTKYKNELTEFVNALSDTKINSQGTFPSTAGSDGEAMITFLNKFGTLSGSTLTKTTQILSLENVRDSIKSKSTSIQDLSPSNEYAMKENDLDEAKARYEMIMNPEQKVGYYEGWFPIFRPMKESALFGVFGAGLFLLILSILVFLNMNGVSISVELPTGDQGISLPDFSNSRPWLLGGVALGAIVAYLLNKYT